MCDFPSWIRSFSDSTIDAWLTDADVIERAGSSQLNIDWYDWVGHGAIEKVYPHLSGYHCEGLSRPDSMPTQLIADILEGRMDKMAAIGLNDGIAISAAAVFEPFFRRLLLTEGISRDFRARLICYSHYSPDLLRSFYQKIVNDETPVSRLLLGNLLHNPRFPVDLLWDAYTRYGFWWDYLDRADLPIEIIDDLLAKYGTEWAHPFQKYAPSRTDIERILERPTLTSAQVLRILEIARDGGWYIMLAILTEHEVVRPLITEREWDMLMDGYGVTRPRP